MKRILIHCQLAEGGIAPRMGHLIMMEEPERLAEACLGFLRRRGILASGA